MITPSVEPVASGPTYSMINLAKYLSQSDKLDFKLITFNFFDSSKNQHSFEKRFRLSGKKEYGFSIDFIKFLWRELKLSKNLIIYNNSQYYLHSIFIFLFRYFYSFTLIFSPRGSLDDVALKKTGRVFIKKILLKPYLWLLSCTDYLVCTSIKEQESVKRYFPDKEIFVLPNSSNPPKVSSSKKRNSFIYIGRIIPQKGIQDLINAWKKTEIMQSHWELLIIGPATDVEYFNKISDECKDYESIKFLGQIDGLEKWEAISSAKFLVLPSYSENFGNVVIEAMMCGTVPITTNDIPWQILNTHNIGFSCNRIDLSKTIMAASQLSNDKFSDISKRTKKFAEENYHANVVAQKFIEYLMLIDKPKS